MSYNSLAALRKNSGEDLAKLAEEHFQHDLNQSDRDALRSAASKVSTYALIGSLAGVALGGFLAFRLRSNRLAAFRAFRAAEKPTHIRFANGQEVALPDISPFLAPTTLGDIATYTFFGMGGVFIGGELGLLSGSWSAKSTISHNPEMKSRIERAFRAFKADVLRKEIDELERGTDPILEF